MAKSEHVTVTLSDTDGPSRPLFLWRHQGASRWDAVRRYAREHGCAGASLMDGRYRILYMVKGKLHQRTYASFTARVFRYQERHARGPRQAAWKP